MEKGKRKKKRLVPQSNTLLFKALLSREHVAAFHIQNAWRCYRILKKQHTLTKNLKKGSIVVYGSSLGPRKGFLSVLTLLSKLGIRCEMRDLAGNASH